MRLLHILSQRPGLSGSGVFLLALVREAARLGIKQHVIVAGPQETSARDVPPLSPEQVSLVTFPSPRAPFPVPGNSDVMPYPSTVFSEMTRQQMDRYASESTRVMREADRSFRPTLVHSHHLWVMTALARKVFADTPLVATAHNSELRQLVKAPQWKAQVIQGIRKVDAIGVLTARSQQDTIKAFGVDPQRVHITGAGFRDDIFRTTTKGRQRLLERLASEFGVHLPSDPDLDFITFAGRLSSPKGFPYLLSAFRRLGQERPRLRLIVVGAPGSGDDGPQMVRQVEKAGPSIIATGAIPQASLGLILQLSRLFVLPSLFEGLPLVMLEAAACGCPCLMSRLPSVESWVPRDWITSGALSFVDALQTVEADRPIAQDVERYVDDLAKGMRDMLDQPWDEADRQTQAARLRPHSWTHVFARYQRIYSSLLG